MRSIVFLVLMLMVSSTIAQFESGRLVLFTEEGDKFEAVCNGLSSGVMDSRAEFDEALVGVNHIRIVFDDGTAITKKIVIDKPGVESTYMLKRSGKKDNFVARYVGYRPLNPVVYSYPQDGSFAQSSNPQPTIVLTGGSGNCGHHSEAVNFNSLKYMMNETAIDSKKLDIAKRALSDKSIVSAQVSELMDEFTFEKNKLEFAKYAYHNTVDKSMYHVVIDKLEFRSHRDELNEYVLNH